MRTQTPLAPSKPAFDVTIHIVLNDFGPLGRAYCETDEDDADEKTIVEIILRGEYSCPERVIAFNTADGWSRDVTEDIARAVRDLARSEDRSIGKVAQEFLERTLGGIQIATVSAPGHGFAKSDTCVEYGSRDQWIAFTSSIKLSNSRNRRGPRTWPISAAVWTSIVLAASSKAASPSRS
jgi:hypothetical protein